MFKNLRKKKRGFTLIELLIVLGIIAVLSAMAIPKFGGIKENAMGKVDLANAKTIANTAIILLEQGKEASSVAGEVKTGSAVGDYMQTIPTLQGGGNFTVVVKGGEVSVTDGKETIYPK